MRKRRQKRGLWSSGGDCKRTGKRSSQRQWNRRNNMWLTPVIVTNIYENQPLPAQKKCSDRRRIDNKIKTKLKPSSKNKQVLSHFGTMTLQIPHFQYFLDQCMTIQEYKINLTQTLAILKTCQSLQSKQRLNMMTRYFKWLMRWSETKCKSHSSQQCNIRLDIKKHLQHQWLNWTCLCLGQWRRWTHLWLWGRTC